MAAAGPRRMPGVLEGAQRAHPDRRAWGRKGRTAFPARPVAARRMPEVARLPAFLAPRRAGVQSVRRDALPREEHSPRAARVDLPAQLSLRTPAVPGLRREVEARSRERPKTRSGERPAAQVRGRPEAPMKPA